MAMTVQNVSPELQGLALDLSISYPRSPRETLAGYVLAARMLDKCRAELAGTNGEYHFDCPLDNMFLNFAEINAGDFKSFVATGANDEAVAQWIEEHAKTRTRQEIVLWNNEMRDKRLSDLPPEAQMVMEDYIPQNIPKGRIIYHWFDVYDIEEERI